MDHGVGRKGDQRVAVNSAKIPARTRADRLEKRLERLRNISEGTPQRPDQVSLATTALSRVLRDGGRDLAQVYLRESFVLRRVALQGEMSDRRPPVAAEPPVLELMSPNGIAQQLALIAIFVAQAQKHRHQDGRITFDLPLETTDADSYDWLDLVVPHSTHSQGAVFAASRRDNRLRQVKRALDGLAEKSLVVLPNVRDVRGKYAGFRLLDEGGPRLTGPPLAYRVPSPDDNGLIALPVDFFLQGWVYVLTKSEIALLLMLRHFQGGGSEASAFSVSGDIRLRNYGVKKDAYKGWGLLAECGLLEVAVDPRRRSNGTVVDFDRRRMPDPHQFQLLDDGFRQPAAISVKAAIAAALDGDRTERQIPALTISAP